MWMTKQKREGKERHCRALQKNSDWVCDSKEKEGIPKKELVHIYLLWVSWERMRWHFEKSICWKRIKLGNEGQTTVQDAIDKYEIMNWKGDVVALKQNYQRYITALFLAILLKDLHRNGDAFLEDHMGLRWLKQSEKDPLVYQTGYHDDRNSPECIIGKV